MAPPTTKPTGIERVFDPDEIIVSKTDTKGRITYANDVFLRVAQYSEEEVLGKPHNFIRHPDMPRCVFQFLWDTIQSGSEIFAYVLNMAKSGDHYWVFAHVTPSYDPAGRHTGYHSSRRLPDRAAVVKVRSLYAKLLAEERKHTLPRQQISASLPMLVAFLEQHRTTYEEFVFSL